VTIKLNSINHMMHSSEIKQKKKTTHIHILSSIPHQQLKQLFTIFKIYVSSKTSGWLQQFLSILIFYTLYGTHQPEVCWTAAVQVLACWSWFINGVVIYQQEPIWVTSVILNQRNSTNNTHLYVKWKKVCLSVVVHKGLHFSLANWNTKPLQTTEGRFKKY
jgi:hypothetical protein